MSQAFDGPRLGSSGRLSVGQWVEQAARAMDAAGLYFGHGTASSIDEACWMISHVMALPPDFSDNTFDQPLDDTVRATLDALCLSRISTRKPLAYLIGEAWFAGLLLEVSEAALVPRSPMAEVILGNALPWFDFHQARRVLDVGTGSGAIAAAMAHHWPQVVVDAVDISPEALALARANIDRLGLDSRVSLHLSDVYEALSKKRFDVILANPPYVPISSMENLPEEYGHEPSLGLVSGESGLDVTIRLVTGASAHLEPGGVLICEVGEAAEAFDAWAMARRLEIVWLEFEHGGDGVFLVTKDALSSSLAPPKYSPPDGTIRG